jgi:hypothetical protein
MGLSRCHMIVMRAIPKEDCKRGVVSREPRTAAGALAAYAACASPSSPW